MNKLKGSFAVKTAAVFLLAVLVLTALLGAAGITALAERGAYSYSLSYVSNEAMERIVRDYTAQVGFKLQYGVDPAWIFDDVPNFRFTVTDGENGKLIFSNAGAVGDSVHCEMDFPEYRVTGYVPRAVTEGDAIYEQLSLLRFGYSARYALIAACALSLILGIIDFIFLLCAAGHRRDTEAIVPSFVEKIPFDVFTALIVGAFAGMIYIGSELATGMSSDYAGVAAACLCVMLGGLLALLFFMSFAVRVKMGGLIRGCICFKLIVWLWGILRRVISRVFGLIRHIFAAIRYHIRAMTLLRRTVLYILVAVAAELMLMAMFDAGGDAYRFWFVQSIFLVPLSIYIAVCFHRLRTAAKGMAEGDLDLTVDTKYLKGEFLAHANDLNSIRGGINAAVAERMKSERFRTELITNVSHDIKTPLTSIISYVDLLGKEELQNDTARDYVEVLERQSAKLKKLTDDLIEASKASTGSLKVNPEPCELGVLLEQAVGEYSGRLAAKRLEPVLKKPGEPLYIMADGRHIWRVFDNLMNNICKYALPGTRVYLQLGREGDRAVVTLRNISEQALNVSGEELLERFVRGDSSRTGEGSGLGLNIARSLVQLQKGELAVSVDGDLFKVTLTFPLPD